MTGYHGGKAKGGKEISEIIYDIVVDIENERNKNFNIYWEPFVGMAGIYRHIVDLFSENMKFIASDLHPSLIKMWKGLQTGNFDPPKNITKDMYEKAKKSSSSALKAYIGFSTTYGGKYFGGYVRSRKPDSEKIKKIADKLINVNFKTGDYTKINNDIKNAIIYCDPPYSNCKNSYFKMDGITSVFDNDEFWKWVTYMSKENLVFISEYKAPKNFKSIYTRKIRSCSFGKIKREHLFIHEKWYNMLSD